MQQLPVTFRSSRKKMALLLLISSIFVVGGVWLLPREPLIAVACIVFFGLGVVVAAINFHPRSSYLTLTKEGLLFASLFRKHFVAWSSVQTFEPVSINLNKMVGWNYTPEFRESARLRRISTALAGVEAGLPDTYGMSAADLAGLLNELRMTYGKPAP